jgi:hypothetical protein
MILAIAICPILWKTAPTILIVGKLKYFEKRLYKKDIMIVLVKLPTTLNRKVEGPPPKREPKKVLLITTVTASLKPKIIIVNKVMILAKPIFTPGTGIGTGINLSIT